MSIVALSNEMRVAVCAVFAQRVAKNCGGSEQFAPLVARNHYNGTNSIKNSFDAVYYPVVLFLWKFSVAPIDEKTSIMIEAIF